MNQLRLNMTVQCWIGIIKIGPEEYAVFFRAEPRKNQSGVYSLEDNKHLIAGVFYIVVCNTWFAYIKEDNFTTEIKTLTVREITGIWNVHTGELLGVNPIKPLQIDDFMSKCAASVQPKEEEVDKPTEIVVGAFAQ